jgi:hypothetical protein
MPLQFADRVRVLTNTVGTGVLQLGASLPGLQGFSGVIATGNTVQYALEEGTAWEIGIGTFTDNPPLLDRSSIQYSSQGIGVPISLQGNGQVFVTPNAQWFNQLNGLNIGLLPGGILSGPLTTQVPNVPIGAYDPDIGHANALGYQPSGGLYFTQDGVFVLGGLFADGTPNPEQQYLRYDQDGELYLQTGEITSSDGGNTAGVYVLSGDASAGSGSSGPAGLYSGDTSSGNSGEAMLYSGDAIGGGNTGLVSIYSGAASQGVSGNVQIVSGNAVGANVSGGVIFASGNTVDGKSGQLTLTTGLPSGTGTSGSMQLRTGNAANGVTGDVAIASGSGNGTGSIAFTTSNASSGGSGGLLFTTGSSPVATGYMIVQLGASSGGPGGDMTVGSGTGATRGGNIAFTTGNGTAAGSNGGDASVTLGSGTTRAGQFSIKGTGTTNNLTITPGTVAANPITLGQSGTGGLVLPATIFGTAGTNNTLTISPGGSTGSSIFLAAGGSGGMTINPGTTLQSTGAQNVFGGVSNNQITLQAGASSVNLASISASSVAGGLQIQTSSLSRLGFFAATPVAKPSVAGACAGNTAIKALLTALASFGLLTDSTSA